MLFFMVLLIFCKVAYVTNTNAGSAIFHGAKSDLNCWNIDGIAKLKARRAFEDLVPPPVHPEKVSPRYIKDTIHYFSKALNSVQNDADHHTAGILKEALADTIGAHLYNEILPSVRFAYYAGYIPYRSARKIHNYLERIKRDLNTQGLGWKPPPRIPQWSNLTVAKISIGSGKLLDPCTYLVLKRDTNKCIHLPVPKLDDTWDPSAIALPLKCRGLVSLKSPESENILLKYYTTASRCILRSSPLKCRHADFVSFNNNLWYWMKRDIAPHLTDDKLIPGYGGVLRIAAAVQNYGKGLTRRNLFEYQDAALSKWNPWAKLTESYIYINTDWTPALYVGLVIASALTICLLQICYNYMFGEPNGCRCRSGPKRTFSKDIAYTHIESNIPAVLPQHSPVFYNNQKSRFSKSKSSSMGSIRTQKVYDFNENTEKMMAVIMSGNEESNEESTTSKNDSEVECEEEKIVITGESPKSPPKIETSIAQLTIERARSPRSETKTSKPMYSTSTLTRTDVTFCGAARLSDSAWSATTTTTTDKTATCTSSSSKSRSQRSRSSRDLAWARHVISRHSRRLLPSSATELDGHSFITPLTRR